jgi:hypothetical protein
MSITTCHRYHTADLAATNQTQQRTQHTELDAMEAQVTKLLQQIDIERHVHKASAEFLAAKAVELHKEGGAWRTRREEHGRAKEREVEVRGGADDRLTGDVLPGEEMTEGYGARSVAVDQ